MRTLHLSTRERRQLERQLRKSQDVRLYRRTLAILQVDRGATVTEVALALRVSRPSIYRWMERYQESLAMESLRDRSRSGRPAAWTEECSEWLQSLLRRSPAELGYFAVNWTVPLLRDSLKMCSAQKFSDITIRRALRRLDYVWKRPRYVLAPDPEREKKTPNSPQNQEPSASQRAAGGRRDRCTALSPVARQLEPTRRTSACAHFGPKRPSRSLRCHESANRQAAVPGSPTSTAT